MEDSTPLMNMSIYERLKPELTGRSAAHALTNQQVFLSALGGETRSSAPSLDQLLEQLGPLPPYTTLIGACADGMHLFLDLADPRPGSLLIVGDRRCGKAQLAQSIALAAARINSPRKVRLAAVAPRPEDFQAVADTPHCFRVIPSYADEAVQMVLGFAELTQQRRVGRQPGAAVLLIIADLARFLGQLDHSMYDLFEWLVQKGPASSIWPVVTLHTEDVLKVEHRLLSSFGTRLVGKLTNPQIADYLAGGLPYPFETLRTGQQFCAFTLGEWIEFWIPA